MRYIFCLSVICFLALLPVSASGAESAETSLPAESPVASTNAVNAFAVDVYRQLAAEGGNLFFSPYSVWSAMTMAQMGAAGDTAAEMAKTLRFETSADIYSSVRSLRERFDSISEEEGIFRSANRVWLDRSEKLKTFYELRVSDTYGAGLEKVDFMNAPEAARLEINNWVAQMTRDKIKDILQNGDVDNETKLVLVNAVYFNSAWQRPFKITAEEPFRTGKDSRVNVTMMKQTGRFLYGENSDGQWIQVPYKIPGFSLVIFLPRENESFTRLEEFERNLGERPVPWMSSPSAMKMREVALAMPKFKDERRYQMEEILQKLGMNLAFDDGRADFSGMVEEPRKIDSVIHQAFIEIDEKGTEAAAATAAVMVTRATLPSPVPAIEFRADHPFMYCITDDIGTILFMGRVTEPK